MRIRLGYEISFECPARTPVILMLRVSPERQADLETPDIIVSSPSVPVFEYRDTHGNICSRVVAEPGINTFTTDTIIRDSGQYDAVDQNAIQHPVEDLPPETLRYLLPSRYCDTDQLSTFAWNQFGRGPVPPTGWQRVQEIVDFAHRHLTFNYQLARATRTASEGFNERVGVCRDFAHLAITLCRAMNIPARYCTGYLGDIGVPYDPAPMDFSAWFEAYIGGRWYTFDARHNKPRIGRVVIARGRDAADVAITTAFGAHWLRTFNIRTQEVLQQEQAILRVA
jgi:transglutaminase-like putative cysteine protease